MSLACACMRKGRCMPGLCAKPCATGECSYATWLVCVCVHALGATTRGLFGVSLSYRYPDGSVPLTPACHPGVANRYIHTAKDMRAKRVGCLCGVGCMEDSCVDAILYLSVLPSCWPAIAAACMIGVGYDGRACMYISFNSHKPMEVSQGVALWHTLRHVSSYIRIHFMPDAQVKRCGHVPHTDTCRTVVCASRLPRAT